MKVMKINDVEAVEEKNPIFIGGRADRQVFVDDKLSKGLRIIIITFRPGVRTKLHTHDTDQILYVTEGKGIVATEAEAELV